MFLAATLEDMLGDGHIRKGTAQSDGRGVALDEINAHVESVDERLEHVEYALGAIQSSVTTSAQRYDAFFVRSASTEAACNSSVHPLQVSRHI